MKNLFLVLITITLFACNNNHNDKRCGGKICSVEAVGKALAKCDAPHVEPVKTFKVDFYTTGSIDIAEYMRVLNYSFRDSVRFAFNQHHFYSTNANIRDYVNSDILRDELPFTENVFNIYLTPPDPTGLLGFVLMDDTALDRINDYKMFWKVYVGETGNERVDIETTIHEVYHQFLAPHCFENGVCDCNGMSYDNCGYHYSALDAGGAKAGARLRDE